MVKGHGLFRVFWGDSNEMPHTQGVESNGIRHIRKLSLASRIGRLVLAQF